MMTQAFYTGLSGIKSNQFALDVVSDNLANISTTGFRGAEYEFSTLFEDALNTDSEGSSVSSTTGLGTQINATSTMMATGTISSTERNTDLAILGAGWFGVVGEGDPVFTRNGSFSFDSNNDMITQDGFHVLGTMANNISTDGILTQVVEKTELGDVATQGKLQFPKSLTYPSQATSYVNFFGNLGSADEVIKMGSSVIDPEGNINNLSLTFTQAVPQVFPGSQWDVVATTESIDGDTIYDTQTGRAEFNELGEITSSSLTTIDNNGSGVSINLGSSYDGVFAIASANIYASSQSDGSVAGDLVGYNINADAEVIATFSNGKQSSVGQVAVYHFQNDQGLERLNGSNFKESSNSGAPSFFKDANGNNIIGTEISNYSLEGSNIEMTYGLTDLIILQRAYDANSKSITTADQMLQKALDMGA